MKKVVVLMIILLMSVVVVNAAPLGHWLLDEGSGNTAADSSGNGAHLTLDNGDGNWVSEHPTYGTGFSFNSTQRFKAEYPVDGFAFDMSKDFTLSMTIRVNPAVSTAVLMGRFNDEAWTYAGKLLMISSGKLNWQCNGIGSIMGTIDVADGETHTVGVQFIAATGTLNLFVDGEIDATSTGFSNMANVSDAFDFHLGSHIVIDDSLYRPYFGIMSDVIITPEPATLALLGLGGLMLRRKRK